MNLAALAKHINEATGATDSELEAMTFCAAMIFADTMKAKDAGDYFEKRMQAAWSRLNKQEETA